jgi:solute carrier family 25 (mitochondrial phosphate transporter), member 23/24/25/41
MGLLGAVICIGAKTMHNTMWDHIGIVLRDAETGQLMLAEANLSGVKVRPLTDRLKYSQSHEIAVRKLVVKRTDRMRKVLDDFIKESASIPYESNVHRLFNAAVATDTQKTNQDIHILLREKTDALQQVNRDLSFRSSISPFQRTALESEQAQLQRELAHLNRHKKRHRRSRFENSSELTAVFCSALVAAAYQRMNILPEYPPPTEYSPKDFASNARGALHLLHGVNLRPEVFIRAQPKRLHALAKAGKAMPLMADDMDHTHDVLQRDSSHSSVRELLRNTLHKSALSSVNSDDLLTFFEPAYYPPGEVIHRLTQTGDNVTVVDDWLYIIERGTCEVHVPIQHVHGDTSEAQQPQSKSHVASDEETLVTLSHDASPTPHDALFVGALEAGNLFGGETLAPLTLASRCNAVTIVARDPVVAWRARAKDIRKVAEAAVSQAYEKTEREVDLLMAIVESHPSFAHLQHSKKLQKQVVDAFFKVDLPQDHVLMKQDDVGDNFYAVSRGACIGTIASPPDTAGTTAEDHESAPTYTFSFGEGQAFGEVSLLYNTYRGAGVRAASKDTRVFAMDRATFQRLASGYSPHLYAMFRRHASVRHGKLWFMTKEDFLRFLNVESTHSRHRELADVMLRIVARGVGNDLINFSQYVSFDHLMCSPNTDVQMAFCLMDQQKIGTIGFQDLERLIGETADSLSLEQHELDSLRNLRQSSIVNNAFFFGADSNTTRRLTLAQFTRLVKSPDAPVVLRTHIHALASHFRVMYNQWHTAYIDQLQEAHEEGTVSHAVHVIAQRVDNTFEKDRARQLAGAVGVSALAHSLLAPLSRTKLLLQVQSRYYSGTWKTLRSIWRAEGFRGLFRSNGVNMLRFVPTVLGTAALFRTLRRYYKRWMGGKLSLSPSENFVLAGTAGMLCNAAVYPLDIVRVHLGIDRIKPSTSTIFQNGQRLVRTRATRVPMRHNESVFAMQVYGRLVEQGGTRAAARGLLTSSAYMFMFVGLKFALYESFKKVGADTNGTATAAAMTATSVAHAIVHPLDVVRRRMQWKATMHPSRTGIQEALHVLHTRGLRGFYVGFGCNILRTTPMVALSFMAYEKFSEENVW